MEVQLTPDQKAFVRQAIETGRLQPEEDAVREAPSLWEERERTRAEILSAVDEAEVSLARGDARPADGPRPHSTSRLRITAKFGTTCHKEPQPWLRLEEKLYACYGLFGSRKCLP
jgi:Arc/MetJ-type ribon-helix-helix transcriptional regulator